MARVPPDGFPPDQVNPLRKVSAGTRQHEGISRVANNSRRPAVPSVRSSTSGGGLGEGAGPAIPRGVDIGCATGVPTPASTKSVKAKERRPRSTPGKAENGEKGYARIPTLDQQQLNTHAYRNAKAGSPPRANNGTMNRRRPRAD